MVLMARKNSLMELFGEPSGKWIRLMPDGGVSAAAVTTGVESSTDLERIEADELQQQPTR